MDVTIDFDNLTVGEAIRLEDLSERPISWWIERIGEPLTARQIYAVAVVFAGMSEADALALKLTEVN